MAKAKKQKKTEPRTLVTFLLDRSGSMGSCRDSTIEAFNGYVDGMRDTPTIDFTLVLFDSHLGVMDLNKVCVGVEIGLAPWLSPENYVPRGSTPLIDATYTVITAVEKSLLDKPAGTKVVVCIQTDGFENCSKDHSWDELSTLIKAKQEQGWQFNFMGAGIDAYRQGARMGIAPQSTVSYDHLSKEATTSIYASSARNTQSFAAGLSSSTEFSMGQRMAAGDKYIKDLNMGVMIQPKIVQPVVSGVAGFSLDYSETKSVQKPKDFSL